MFVAYLSWARRVDVPSTYFSPFSFARYESCLPPSLVRGWEEDRKKILINIPWIKFEYFSSSFFEFAPSVFRAAAQSLLFLPCACNKNTLSLRKTSSWNFKKYGLWLILQLRFVNPTARSRLSEQTKWCTFWRRSPFYLRSFYSISETLLLSAAVWDHFSSIWKKRPKQPIDDQATPSYRPGVKEGNLSEATRLFGLSSRQGMREIEER